MFCPEPLLAFRSFWPAVRRAENIQAELHTSQTPKSNQITKLYVSNAPVIPAASDSGAELKNVQY